MEIENNIITDSKTIQFDDLIFNIQEIILNV